MFQILDSDTNNNALSSPADLPPAAQRYDTYNRHDKHAADFGTNIVEIRPRHHMDISNTRFAYKRDSITSPQHQSFKLFKEAMFDGSENDPKYDLEEVK